MNDPENYFADNDRHDAATRSANLEGLLPRAFQKILIHGAEARRVVCRRPDSNSSASDYWLIEPGLKEEFNKLRGYGLRTYLILVDGNNEPRGMFEYPEEVNMGKRGNMIQVRPKPGIVLPPERTPKSKRRQPA